MTLWASLFTRVVLWPPVLFFDHPRTVKESHMKTPVGCWFMLIGLVLIGSSPQIPTPMVVVSIDGLKPDYVLESERRGLKIPNLRRFLKEGTYASGVEGVVPTVTYPSHTTLVTGV